jgi:hypothetical protein
MAHAMGRGRDNKPFWRLAIARWRQSGLSVSAFCRAEGLREPSFYQSPLVVCKFVASAHCSASLPRWNALNQRPVTCSEPRIATR